MNHNEFINMFIFNNPTYNEVQCPSTEKKCKVFIAPHTVLVKGNSILIVGDNRQSKIKERNKIILINNIDLDNNTFDMSYIESKLNKSLYIYLFSLITDTTSNKYNIGFTVSYGLEDYSKHMYSTYEEVENFLHPPSITLNNGNLALKFIDKTTNQIIYKHIPLNFTLNEKDDINYQTEEIIKKNAEDYKTYFHQQITNYQNYYKDKLKLLEAQRILAEQEEVVKVEDNTELYKIIAMIVLIILLIISVIIAIFMPFGKNKNLKKPIYTPL
jgi:hypothetical protein